MGEGEGHMKFTALSTTPYGDFSTSIYALGEDGLIYKLRPDGQAWQPLPPAPEGMDMALSAVLAQADDAGLWAKAETAPEAYLQESLRDLHSVIEHRDAAALQRILSRVRDT